MKLIRRNFFISNNKIFFVDRLDKSKSVVKFIFEIQVERDLQ